MGFMDKLFGKKSKIYNEETPQDDKYVEDLTDDGAGGLNARDDNGPVFDFDSTSSEVKPPEPSGFEKTSNEFTRLNNDQLDPESKTGMKKKKEKTFFSTISKKLRKTWLDMKDSAKNGADVASGWNIQNSVGTAEEKNYKGLKKSYIYIAIGIFVLMVMSMLVFGNDSDPKKRKMPTGGGNMRTTGANVSGGGSAITGLPKNYSDVAEMQNQSGLDLNNTKKKNSEKLREDAKKDERGKKEAKTKEVQVKETKPAKSPAVPEVPPMPGESGAKVKQVVKSNMDAEKAKEAAIKSNISFGISNGGIK